MNILVIGTGYVGATTGLVLAELGHMVTGLDTNSDKIESLRKGRLYFYEPGLEELLVKHIENKTIKFTTEVEKSIMENDIIFICVGTPSNPDGSADLTFVQAVSRNIGQSINRYKVIVNKSTVPVGTTEQVKMWIKQSQIKKNSFDVISNPEFLREGSALHDALHPDRVVIGSTSEKATKVMKELYQGINCPLLVTTPIASELIKYTANSFLAMKISYMNEIARLCDRLNVRVKDVSRGIGLDQRIGNHFLQAGIGYGGSCFPKDVTALLNTAYNHDINLTILKEVIQVNKTQPFYFLTKVRQTLGTFQDKTIALYGLSFKPYTDDIRESPSFIILNELLNEQVVIKVHDPIVKIAEGYYSNNVEQYQTPEEAAQNADAILICTDWPIYKNLDWAYLKNKMKTAFIFDGRNMLDADQMNAIGFDYYGIGYR